MCPHSRAYKVWAVRVSDWQGVVYQQPPILSTTNYLSGGAAGDVASCYISQSGAAVWPAANRAIYLPVVVQRVCTAYQFLLNVSVQSGNLDVGIYDEWGNRQVSAGSTAVAAAGVQLVNITDTVLTPGVYFLAMNCDNTTASFTRGSIATALQLQSYGVQQQAVGAVALPDPATFADPASAYFPMLAVATKSSVI